MARIAFLSFTFYFWICSFNLSASYFFLMSRLFSSANNIYSGKYKEIVYLSISFGVGFGAIPSGCFFNRLFLVILTIDRLFWVNQHSLRSVCRVWHWLSLVFWLLFRLWVLWLSVPFFIWFVREFIGWRQFIAGMLHFLIWEELLTFV